MNTTALNTKVKEVEYKIPGSSGLMTTAFLNTKKKLADNKIHDSDLKQHLLKSMVWALVWVKSRGR